MAPWRWRFPRLERKMALRAWGRERPGSGRGAQCREYALTNGGTSELPRLVSHRRCLTEQTEYAILELNERVRDGGPEAETCAALGL
jgi:hypothetical protein